jgi:hypothetical protein
VTSAAKASATKPAVVRLPVPPQPKMLVLLDTNVVLDVLLARAPHDFEGAPVRTRTAGEVLALLAVR